MSTQGTICSLCFNTYRNPMLLKCGHSLCEECVKRAEGLYAAFQALEPPNKRKQQDAAEAEVPSVECPMCGKVTPVAQCKPNPTLRKAISLTNNVAELELAGDAKDAAAAAAGGSAAAAGAGEGDKKEGGGSQVCGFCKGPATVFCAFCGALCQEHSDFLHVKGPMRAHELSKTPVEVVRSVREAAASAAGEPQRQEGALVLPLCKDHGKQMELFCAKCETLVCAHCILIGDHKDHECTSVLEAFKKTNERVEELLKAIKEKAPECEELLKGYSRLQAGADKELQDARAQIKEAFAAFRARVDEHEAKATKELDDIFASFTKTVAQRAEGLHALSRECQLVQQSSETAAAKNELMRYTLFKSLKNLADHLDVIAMAQVPDDATVCSVEVNKGLLDPEKDRLNLVKVRSMFRLGCGRVIMYNIDFDAVQRTRNVTSDIPTGNATSHDGGAIFDPVRRIILSVSGNFNNGRNLKITTLGEAGHGETTTRADVIPYGTHGQYPVYDGRQFTYFFESESGDNNRLGRVDMDTFAFETLARLPTSSFREFCSPCCHNGNLYALDRDLSIREYNPDTNEWRTLPITLPRPARLLNDPCEASIIYALCSDGRGLFRVDLEANTSTHVSDAPSNFSLGANGEAFLARINLDEFLIFAGLSAGWHVYSRTANRWATLPNWRNVRNGSGHFVIDPEGPTAYYHVDDNTRWEMVNLRE